LVGPISQYVYDSDTQSIQGALSTGYIKDQGDTDVDTLNRQIEDDRGFIEWRHKHKIGERVTLTGSVSSWSDSDVIRDFREDYYESNQRPDSFIEGEYSGDNYIVSAFTRFRPNDFQIIQERLPEIRYDLLPIPIGETGAYQQLSASFASLREKYNDNSTLITQDTENDRFDIVYSIERPYQIKEWLTLTPIAGARFTHYSNQELDPALTGTPPFDNDDFTRSIFEFGFDLKAHSYANYSTQNRIWDIDGLRHIVRPVMSYRYFSDPDASDEVAAIDREAFDLDRQLLDLSDLRSVDSLDETHLIRLGVENLYQTRADEYGSRTLAALNFYQDILFEKDKRFDGHKEDTLNATWVEMKLTPAPWIKFDIASRFNTERLTLEELKSSLRLISGEIWEIGISTDNLNQRIEQYRVDFIYRINERYALLADIRYDAELGDITRTNLGIRTRIGSTWEVIYALTFREKARREDDVEFSLQLHLANQ
jgi:LPS-assembly protein